MSVREAVRPKATVPEQFALEALMAEPETSVSDAPRYVINGVGVGILTFLLSPKLPKK
jgi:hypothetical protein